MTIRIAAIGVSHWHAVHDAAYLRHLTAMPDVDLVSVEPIVRRVKQPHKYINQSA